MGRYKNVVLILAPLRKQAKEAFNAFFKEMGHVPTGMKVDRRTLKAEGEHSFVLALACKDAYKVRGMRITDLIIEEAYLSEALEEGKVNLADWETAVSLAKSRLVSI